MRKKILLFMVVLCVLICTLFVFTVTAASEEDNVLVTCLAYQTGFGWDSGKAEFWAMHLAIDEINKEGGVLGKKVVYRDIHLGYNNEDVATAFKQAASLQPVAIVGGCEAGTQDAVAELQRDIGLPQVVLYACSGKLTQPGYFYGGFHTNIYPDQFLLPVKKLIEDKGGTKLAVVMDDCGYGHLAVDTIEKWWPEGPQKLVDVEWYVWEEAYEMRPQIQKVLSLNPDVIHVGVWSEAGAVGLAKILRELHYEGLVTFDCGGLSDPLIKTVKKAGESLEGVYGVRTWMPDPEIPESMAFDKAFREFPETGGLGAWDYASGAYIAMKSILMAMNIAGTTTDRLAIADAMYDNHWVTPYGEPALWLPGGQFFTPNTYLGLVKDGEIVLGVKKKLTLEDFNTPYKWFDAYQKGMDAYRKEFRK